MPEAVEREDEFEISSLVEVDAAQAALVLATMRGNASFKEEKFWEYLLRNGSLDEHPDFLAFLRAHQLRHEDADGKRRLRIYDGGNKPAKFELKSSKLDALVGTAKVAECREVRMPVDRQDKTLMKLLRPQMIAGITKRTRFHCNEVLTDAIVHLDVFENLANAGGKTFLKTDIEVKNGNVLDTILLSVFRQRQEYFFRISEALGLNLPLFMEGKRASQTDFAKAQWKGIGKGSPMRNPRHFLPRI